MPSCSGSPVTNTHSFDLAEGAPSAVLLVLEGRDSGLASKFPDRWSRTRRQDKVCLRVYTFPAPGPCRGRSGEA